MHRAKTISEWLRLAAVASGAVLLFLMPIATLAWLSRTLPPAEGIAASTPRLQRVAFGARTPDLPRPRPAEPVHTGSIGRTEAPTIQVSSVLPPVDVPIADRPSAAEGWTPAADLNEDLPDAAAVSACEDRVREGLPLPTELFRVVASTEVYRAPGEDAVVVFDFDTFNGLRFPLSLEAHCVFDGRRLARLEVQPRLKAGSQEALALRR